MQRGAVALDFSRRSSSDFEEIHHPENQYTEELPLHYMNAEPRRRVVGRSQQEEQDYSTGNNGSPYSTGPAYYDDDDQGKTRPPTNRVTSGRVYQPPPPPPSSVREFLEQNMEHVIPIIYTLLSCWTRFHKIGLDDAVVWDEAHFGKFGSHYLKREFYFDVHPPLGKMIVGFVGLLAGYDGSFEFKSGEKYPDSVPYVAMRVMMATFGVGMVPLGWYTAVELGMSQWTCHLVTLMVLLDVGWLVISRFILLDSMLLFFTFLVVFCLAKFHNEQRYPFSFDWWMWLAFTGFSIGLVTSVKMIGLFVTALVGLYTAEDLWNKFGDLKMPLQDQARHWIARIGCLIVLPIVVFMASFKLHFMVLNHSGPGDAQMSSLFQANLVGNDFANNPLEIAFGSKLTLKNVGYGGGLLHSHVQTFPVGSNQQQVTCYHYKDDNNHWNIMPTWDGFPNYNHDTDIVYLKHNDIIRLQHAPTSRNLHSHSVPAPVTKANHEVSCYGNDTIGDSGDHWKVEVVDDINRGRREKFERIHSLTTRMRFRHQTLGCYLRAANAILPQWGFKQIEVSCIPEDDPSDAHTYWNVESHWNDKLPAGNTKYYRSPFFRDFWDLNVAMMTSNNALIPDADKEDILASGPFDWPWLHLGLRMCGWGDTQVKYYLLGTPVIRYASTASLAIFLVMLGIYVLRRQRKYVDMDDREWEQFLYVGKLSFIGWVLHFAPFVLMSRVTYVHHYLPTLWFSVLLLGHLLDHFIFSSRRLTQRTKTISFSVCAGSIILCFWWFRGMAFGMEGPIADHWGLQWRKSWNIYNNLG